MLSEGFPAGVQVCEGTKKSKGAVISFQEEGLFNVSFYNGDSETQLPGQIFCLGA